MAGVNGILPIDKPAGWTSHDVVAKLRGILHERRIGHSGTLDPMATGVLVVFVGRATRAVEFSEADEKEYVAKAKFGIKTDTQDITGNIIESCDNYSFSEENILEVLNAFNGEIEQVPPMYSAIKQNGQKLYELARKGISVERKSRKILISSIELINANHNEIEFSVTCSKGTYIRTLAHDIGQRLGCGAALSSLRRTRVGNFAISDCLTMDEIEWANVENRISQIIHPIDSLFYDKEAVTINTFCERKCLNGAEFPIDIKDGIYRVYSENGKFMALGNAKSGIMHTIKSFFEPVERL